MEHNLIYYIDLQRRLQDIFLYVSCHEENFSTYSIKIESVLIDTCSFFESLCQMFIRDLKEKNRVFAEENKIIKFHEKMDVNNRSKRFNIHDYEKLLNVDFALYDKGVVLDYGYPIPILYTFHLHRTSRKQGYPLQPFSGWTDRDTPFWWKAFTDLKHDRLTNFQKASLKNVIYALAAVFIIVTLMNEELFRKGRVSEEVYRMFSIQYWPQTGSVMSGIPLYRRNRK